MIDENGNVITTRELLKRVYCYIKENTAQIAIIIPILAALYAVVSDYYFYLNNLGYYKYFAIDDRLMLPYNKINLYKNIVWFAIVVLYWGYAIFTVRMFLLKRNYLGKFITALVIPFLMNIFFIFNGEINSELIIVSGIFILFHWLMIFALGYCMAISFNKEGLEKNKEVNKKKKANRKVKTKRWGDKEYRLLGGILIVVGGMLLFLQGYSDGKMRAAEERRFGIVTIDEEEYVVIDANEDKLILQKCEVRKSDLLIDVDTYLSITNNKMIDFKYFNTVRLTRADSKL